MANIQQYLDNIKNALFGREVRSSIHDGIDAINKEVERTTAKQEHLDGTFNQLIINSGNSNAEVVDARVEADGTQHATLGERLDNFDSQLETNSINIKIQRRFKPKFGISPWWIDTTTEDQNKVHIDRYKELGCEKIPFVVHVTNNGGIYSSSEDLDRHLRLYDYIIEKGMSVSMLKFHIYGGLTESEILNDVNVFFTKYTEVVETWLKAFEGKIKKCTILNELSALYNDSRYDNLILDLIKKAKGYNYEVSFSYMGESEVFKTSKTILGNLDFIGINLYPRISEKAEKTTFEDSLFAWDKRIPAFEALYKINQNIVITEMGSQHYYECLSNPGRYDWSGQPQTDAKGRAAILSVYGLFESSLKDYISAAYYWYYDSLYYDECKDFIKSYIGG
mgnify:CR=1 FL=1